MIMKKLQEDVDQHKSIFIESESQTTSIFDQFQPVDVSEVITLVQRAPKIVWGRSSSIKGSS